MALTSPSPVRVALGCFRTRPSMSLPSSPSTYTIPSCVLRLQSPSKQSTTLTDRICHRRPLSTAIPAIAIRRASTDASTLASDHQPAAASTALTWNDYLRLRKVRRRFNLVGSVVTATGSFTVGVSLLSQQNIDYLAQQLFGLDPFFVIGLWTAGFIALGWLLGPLVGTAAFRLTHRRVERQMADKERDFFERIKKFRVDPTSSSVQNPVPDYYGEKITSVAGYRQWLKDQRAFNKKRQSFV